MNEREHEHITPERPALPPPADGNGHPPILLLPPNQLDETIPEAFGRSMRDDLPEAFGKPPKQNRKQEKKSKKKSDKDEDEDDQDEEGKEDDEKDENENKDEDDDDEKDDEKKEDKDEDKDKPKKPPFYKRPIPMIIIGSILILAIIIGLIWWLHARQFETTDDAFIDGHIIPISPNVAATVANVWIDDNWHVKKGDKLVDLDPKDFQVIVNQMTANFAAAQNRVIEAQVQLDVSQANVGEARAQITIAQANFENANRDYERFSQLSERARSQQQLDNATAAQKTAGAQVEQAKARLTAAQANVANAQTAIKTAQASADRAAADLHQAQINLGYCTITAPEDGMITKKNVEPGVYVDKAQPLFSIVPDNVWVTANYKETQLDLIRVGQSVTIKVDAYTDRTFHGKVDSIQNGSGVRFSLLPPENATGNYVKIVQRVPVKIVFDQGETNDKNHVLGPGMSVYPEIKVR
jgi:membrane fusion protein (multidrug efflux system)